MLNWRIFLTLAIGTAHLGLAQTCCLADDLQNSQPQQISTDAQPKSSQETGEASSARTSKNTDLSAKTAEFVEYLRDLQNTIEEFYWTPSNNDGHKKLTIKFNITNDGHQSVAQIEESSGSADVDQGAIDAVRASQFKPFPKAAPAKVALEVTFDYDGAVVSAEARWQEKTQARQ